MIDMKFPMVDLHRHIEGSVRLETILELGQKYDLPLPAQDVEGLRPYVQVTEPQPGVMAFLAKFKWAVGILVDYDACRRIAYDNVLIAKDEGIDYIELRFSPGFMAEPHSLDPVGVVEAVVDGVRQGADDTGVKTNLIGIISRTYGQEAGMKELQALLTKKDDIVALDLAGDEANFPGELFVEHFRIGREAGWEITVHAGEAAGAESIWQTIKGLGATRIGHAARAADDVDLMKYIVDNGIGIEANLTSNVQTMTVGDYAAHPLKVFLEMGMLATINTDDPAISGIDLPYEYNHAAHAAGLNEKQIAQAQRNALEIAFLNAEAKSALMAAKS
ncbi:MAG: adenosine deaminase [Anaerolineales bacterium]|nr:adenosine deaminase [Anaerolineales bacterium]